MTLSLVIAGSGHRQSQYTENMIHFTALYIVQPLHKAIYIQLQFHNNCICKKDAAFIIVIASPTRSVFLATLHLAVSQYAIRYTVCNISKLIYNICKLRDLPIRCAQCSRLHFYVASIYVFLTSAIEVLWHTLHQCTLCFGILQYLKVLGGGTKICSTSQPT